MSIVEVLCKAKQLYETHPEYMGMCHCIGLAIESMEYLITLRVTSENLFRNLIGIFLMLPKIVTLMNFGGRPVQKLEEKPELMRLIN